MAGDHNVPECKSTKLCKYCDKTVPVVTKIVRCSVCESVCHSSCALRVVGLVVVERNNLVKCVQQSEVMTTGNNELLSKKDQLIESKDYIITELKEKYIIRKH